MSLLGMTSEGRYIIFFHKLYGPVDCNFSLSCLRACPWIYNHYTKKTRHLFVLAENALDIELRPSYDIDVVNTSQYLKLTTAHYNDNWSNRPAQKGILGNISQLRRCPTEAIYWMNDYGPKYGSKNRCMRCIRNAPH